MADLYLISPIAKRRPHSPSYMRQALTRDRVRYLLDLLGDVAVSQAKYPNLLCYELNDPDVEFVSDFAFDKKMGSVGSLHDPLHVTREHVITGHWSASAVVQRGLARLRIAGYSLHWAFRAIHQVDFHIETAELFRSTLRRAWRLVCSEAELPDAICDFLAKNPEWALEWIATGRIVADDGSCERPLPALNTADLIPLLQHQDPQIRERTIASLPSLKLESSLPAQFGFVRPGS